MTLSIVRQAVFAAAAGLAMVATVPVGAVGFQPNRVEARQIAPLGDMSYDHDRRYRSDRYDRYDRYDRRDHYRRDANYGRYRDEPVYRDTRVWRGRDGRYYCNRRDGTTGLLIGAGVGALAGHEIAGRGGDRTLGAIIGAAGGAILGRAIDRSDSRCR